MRPAIARAPARRAGLTLIELVVATALMSILMLAIFQLLQSALGIWERTESRRELVEGLSGVARIVDRDLRAVDGGPRGDFLVDWNTFDLTGDGVRDTLWPRIRMVRTASAAELQHLPVEQRPPDGQGLLEVAWAVVPASSPGQRTADPDVAAEGLLLRGERLAGSGVSIFSSSWFDGTGLPPAGLTAEVSGGVLWMGVLCATQTSILHDGWTLGDELEDCASSWDAWSRDRPDVTLHAWNLSAAGMPEARDRALLPRRVRVELEIERPKDRRRRTRIVSEVAVEDSGLRVDDPSRLPRGEDRFVLIGTEWMELKAVHGDRITVGRGARGSRRLPHQPGEMVHWGKRLVREIPIALYREDWNL